MCRIYCLPDILDINICEQRCEELEQVHSESFMIFHMKLWTKTFQSLVCIWNQMASQYEEVKYIKYLSI